MVYASQITIDTYNYAGYLENAYDSTYNMVYKVLDRGDWVRDVRSKAPQTYQTIVIENDYLVATVIPALGGRVYSLVFKPTGNNEFYSNTVIKPTRWGPPQQDWWLFHRWEKPGSLEPWLKLHSSNGRKIAHCPIGACVLFPDAPGFAHRLPPDRPGRLQSVLA